MTSIIESQPVTETRPPLIVRTALTSEIMKYGQHLKIVPVEGVPDSVNIISPYALYLLFCMNIATEVLTQKRQVVDEKVLGCFRTDLNNAVFALKCIDMFKFVDSPKCAPAVAISKLATVSHARYIRFLTDFMSRLLPGNTMFTPATKIMSVVFY